MLRFQEVLSAQTGGAPAMDCQWTMVKPQDSGNVIAGRLAGRQADRQAGRRESLQG